MSVLTRCLPWSMSLFTLAVLGCGTQGDATVLPDRFPRAGLAGFVLLEEDNPFVLMRPGCELDQPAVSPDPRKLVLYGTVRCREPGAKTAIFSAQPTQWTDGQDPTEALLPTQPWEGTGLFSPSVVDAALAESPTQPNLLLFYQSDDGSLGLARVVEGEDRLEKLTLSAPLLPASALRPPGDPRAVIGRLYALRVASQVLLFYTVAERQIVTASLALEPLRRIAQGTAPPVLSEPITPRTLLTLSDVTLPGVDPKTRPVETLTDVSARRVITPADRPRWDLFFRVGSGQTSSLLAATTYDESPDGPQAPLPLSAPLIKGVSGEPRSPVVTTYQGTQFLLFGLKQVQRGIAIAKLPQAVTPSL